jgi:hypothetical protein
VSAARIASVAVAASLGITTLPNAVEIAKPLPVSNSARLAARSRTLRWDASAAMMQN